MKRLSERTWKSALLALTNYWGGGKSKGVKHLTEEKPLGKIIKTSEDTSIMGGRYGTSVIYLVDKLTRGELRQMGMHRLKTRTVPPGTDRHIPTIGIDCNMVINVVGRFKRDPVASLARFLDEWADHGFVVIPVVDGASPNSKQATMERIEKGKIERAKALELRQKLRVASKRLAEAVLPAASKRSPK